MSGPEDRRGDWGPLLISFIADVAGILGYLGLSGDRTLRVAVTASLAAVGLVIGGVSLWRCIRLWASVDGAYFPTSYHAKRAVGAGMVFILAVLLLIGIARVDGSDKTDERSNSSALAPAAAPLSG